MFKIDKNNYYNFIYIYIYIYITLNFNLKWKSNKTYKFFLNKQDMFVISYKVSKVGDCSRGQPEGSLFNSYYTEM